MFGAFGSPVHLTEHRAWYTIGDVFNNAASALNNAPTTAYP
jgi:hypothetical protein